MESRGQGPASESWWMSLATWIGDYSPNLFNVIVEFGFAVYLSLVAIPNPIEFFKSQWVTLILIIGLGVLSNVFLFTRTKRLSFLEAENARLDNKLQHAISLPALVIEFELQSLSEMLGLSDRDRISLYVHKPNGFLMVGRYSKNPKFNVKGRVVYPDNQGCIAKAWNEGEAFVERLPNPDTNYDAWRQKLKADWAIPIGVSRKFVMCSRTYAAFAIEDSQGRSRRAIIVFESTKSRAFNIDELRGYSNGGDGNRIRNLLMELDSIIPDPEYAKREGY